MNYEFIINTGLSCAGTIPEVLSQTIGFYKGLESVFTQTKEKRKVVRLFLDLAEKRIREIIEKEVTNED